MSTKTPLLTWRHFFLGAIVFVIVWYAGSYWRGMAMSAENKCEARPWERPGQVRRDAEPPLPGYC